MSFPTQVEMRERTLRFRQRLTEASGGLYSAAEVAELIGVRLGDLDAMRERREILGVPVDDEIRYPVGQFMDGHPLPGLRQILEMFADETPWVRLQILHTPLTGFASEPATILQMLRDGVSQKRLEQLAGLVRGWLS